MIEEILAITPQISSLFQCNYIIDKNTATYLYLYVIDQQRAAEFLKAKGNTLQYTVWDRKVIQKLANIGMYEYSRESNSVYTFTNYNENKMLEIYVVNYLSENTYVLDQFNQHIQIRDPAKLMNFYASYVANAEKTYGKNSPEYASFLYPFNEVNFIVNNRDKMRESLKEIMTCDVKEYRLRSLDNREYVEGKNVIRLQDKKVEKKSGCT
jgi:hypothetical protein